RSARGSTGSRPCRATSRSTPDRAGSAKSHIRCDRVSHASQLRLYGRFMAKVITPWGAATVVERVSLPQRAGHKQFTSVFELLEDERGGRLVRIAYLTSGVIRRGPVTLRARDLERLRKAIAKAPDLAAAL